MFNTTPLLLVKALFVGSHRGVLGHSKNEVDLGSTMEIGQEYCKVGRLKGVKKLQIIGVSRGNRGIGFVRYLRFIFFWLSE